MTNFIVYNDTTGEVLRVGDAPDDMIAMQAGDGERSVAVPVGVIAYPDLNLEPLRAKLLLDIDADADAIVRQFISTGAGQQMVYLRKEQEARAWLLDGDPIAASYPFIYREATATGIAVADLVALVIANADAWTDMGSKIDAARRGAKVAVEAAASIKAMVDARTIDWQAVLA